MLRWTRSMPKIASCYEQKDICDMWSCSLDGTFMNGADHWHEASQFAMTALRPKDIFQLEMLNEYLVGFHELLVYESDFAYKFRYAVTPLRYLQQEVKSTNIWYWSAELQRSFDSLLHAVQPDWHPSVRYLHETNWAAYEEEYRLNDTYHEDDILNGNIASAEYWVCSRF